MASQEKKQLLVPRAGGGVACEFTLHIIKLTSQERNTDTHASSRITLGSMVLVSQKKKTTPKNTHTQSESVVQSLHAYMLHRLYKKVSAAPF